MHFMKNTASFPSTSLCQNLLFISFACRCVCVVCIYVCIFACMWTHVCMCVCWLRVNIACPPWSLKFIYCGRVFCWFELFLLVSLPWGSLVSASRVLGLQVKTMCFLAFAWSLGITPPVSMLTEQDLSIHRAVSALLNSHSSIVFLTTWCLLKPCIPSLFRAQTSWGLGHHLFVSSLASFINQGLVRTQCSIYFLRDRWTGTG